MELACPHKFITGMHIVKKTIQWNHKEYIYKKKQNQTEMQFSIVPIFKLAHLHLLEDFHQEKHTFSNHKEFKILILQVTTENRDKVKKY